MLVNAMEASGIDGTFYITCERVMKVLRKNKDSLMAMLEARPPQRTLAVEGRREGRGEG